jgi:hypothetical protein
MGKMPRPMAWYQDVRNQDMPRTRSPGLPKLKIEKKEVMADGHNEIARFRILN